MPSSFPILCGSIAGRPGRFGVAMHTALFRAFGLDYTYVAFGTEDTQGAVAAMRALGIRGLGVTTPHKVRIMSLLDAIDPTAQAIGAVNTVINDAGRLTGFNVDWIGAHDALSEGLDIAGCTAAVVGAGGGARAIAFALVRAGAQVSIYNRGAEAGQALAKNLGARYAGAAAALADAPPYDLLAHATPVGFHDPGAMLIPPSALKPGMVVFDAVAQPPDTRLLRAAQAAGCRTIAGVRMQLHQAGRQFELYTGRKPELAIMEQALAQAMTGQAGAP